MNKPLRTMSPPQPLQCDFCGEALERTDVEGKRASYVRHQRAVLERVRIITKDRRVIVDGRRKNRSRQHVQVCDNDCLVQWVQRGYTRMFANFANKDDAEMNWQRCEEAPGGEDEQTAADRGQHHGEAE
jgi:hypothetical protein